MRALALFTLIVTVVAPGQRTWSCSGPQTKYTGKDCALDKNKMLSVDCYYLPHFQQYRPCSAICNDVVFGSIDEKRCRGYCAGKVLLYSDMG